MLSNWYSVLVDTKADVPGQPRAVHVNMTTASCARLAGLRDELESKRANADTLQARAQILDGDINSS